MDETIAVKVCIYGRVQGVGYRAWTEREATALGLTGRVRNRDDGSVEALFQGPPVTVEKMIALCRKGPSYSKVERIEQSDEPALQTLTEFQIL